MVDATGTTTYSSYDNRDRLKTKATPEGTLNYTYDAHGNLLTIVSSNTNGASMTYTYDVLNRLKTATDNQAAAHGGPTAATSYSYDAAGNLSGYTYSTTLQTGNLFDPLNRLTKTCVATTSPACSAIPRTLRLVGRVAVSADHKAVTWRTSSGTCRQLRRRGPLSWRWV
jgi:YD repeat-containing protein